VVEKRKLTFLDASAQLLDAEFVTNRSKDCNEILYWSILKKTLSCHFKFNIKRTIFMAILLRSTSVYAGFSS